MRTPYTFIIAIFILAVPILAEPVSVSTGPYNVSFDLGVPLSQYVVNVVPVETTEKLDGSIDTKYAIELKTWELSPSSARILVSHNDRTSYAILSPELMTVSLTEGLRRNGYINTIQTATRAMDGTIGAVVSGVEWDSTIMYEAAYVPLTDPNAFVVISSLMPWDTTLMLFKTIHVEKKSLFKEPYIGPTSGWPGKEAGS